MIHDLILRMEMHYEMIYVNPNWESFAKIVNNTDLERAVQFNVNPVDIIVNGGWR